jgi:hypothetical protein
VLALKLSCLFHKITQTMMRDVDFCAEIRSYTKQNFEALSRILI